MSELIIVYKINFFDISQNMLMWDCGGKVGLQITKQIVKKK